MREQTSRQRRPGPTHIARALPNLDEESIRIRAYELWEERHGVNGDAESDWFRAEAELMERLTTDRS